MLFLEDWAVRAIQQMPSIYSFFMGKEETKLKLLHIVGSALKSYLT